MTSAVLPRGSVNNMGARVYPPRLGYGVRAPSDRS